MDESGLSLYLIVIERFIWIAPDSHRKSIRLMGRATLAAMGIGVAR